MILDLAISLVVFSDDTENMAVKGLKDVTEVEKWICIGTEFHTQLRHLILEGVCGWVGVCVCVEGGGGTLGRGGGGRKTKTKNSVLTTVLYLC